MAVNRSLFKEDGAFWLYVDTCQVNNLRTFMPTVGLGFIASLNAYPLLGV